MTKKIMNLTMLRFLIVIISVLFFGKVANAQTFNGHTFLLISVKNGKCLDAAGDDLNNGTKIQLWDRIGQTNQQWKFVDAGNGNYTIHCVANGKCLDADPATLNDNGTRLQLWDGNGGKNQQWSVEYSNGSFLIHSVTNNRCLDAANSGGINNNGNPVLLWDCHGGDNQRWRLEDVNRTR